MLHAVVVAFAEAARLAEDATSRFPRRAAPRRPGPQIFPLPAAPAHAYACAGAHATRHAPARRARHLPSRPGVARLPPARVSAPLASYFVPVVARRAARVRRARARARASTRSIDTPARAAAPTPTRKQRGFWLQLASDRSVARRVGIVTGGDVISSRVLPPFHNISYFSIFLYLY